MGYKLAGYNVIGCNEIDKRMMETYKTNHNPRYAFLEPIQSFKNREDLPSELFNLDILDGSPPCSAFSMAGSREDAWGVEKKFREGQAKQVLDTLFFDFIDLAHRLQPKVVVAENVKGLLLGEATRYMQKIYREFEAAGYQVRHFLLNAADMGVPQKRERVFFVCLRNDLVDKVPTENNLFETRPLLRLDFKEPRISCREARLTLGDPIRYPSQVADYTRLKAGEKPKFFQSALIAEDDVHPTLLASYKTKAAPMPEWEMRWLSDESICKVSTFPTDYNFNGQKPEYICGMSVPPVMMAQVANQIWEQWLSRINTTTT